MMSTNPLTGFSGFEGSYLSTACITPDRAMPVIYRVNERRQTKMTRHYRVRTNVSRFVDRNTKRACRVQDANYIDNYAYLSRVDEQKNGAGNLDNEYEPDDDRVLSSSS